jgi:hypothetical protein
MKRAVLYFKPGGTDFVDPISEPEKDIVYTRDFILVDNGAHIYTYERLVIDRVEIVDIEEEK